jgi:hypothetical protein
MKTSVKFSELKKMPPITRQRLRELSNLPDGEINYTDIPRWTPGDWEKATLVHIRSIPKVDIHTKIDCDLVE